MAIKTVSQVDVPRDLVPCVVAAFKLSEPAPISVESIEQPDGSFTVTVTFAALDENDDNQGSA